MNEYNEKFPLGLSEQEKVALMWKIEEDYQASHLGAIAFKDDYITFAINFYTRNIYSLEDVVSQYHTHHSSVQRKSLADTFLTDMKTKLRDRELAHN